MCHFSHINDYLFHLNYTSFSKIYNALLCHCATRSRINSANLWMLHCNGFTATPSLQWNTWNRSILW